MVPSGRTTSSSHLPLHFGFRLPRRISEPSGISFGPSFLPSACPVTLGDSLRQFCPNSSGFPCQAQQSLGTNLSVDAEGHGSGKKDTHAGGGYRSRNLDALLQTICPSRPRSVLPFQSYPVIAESRRTRNLRRKPYKRAELRSPLISNTQSEKNFPTNFRVFDGKNEFGLTIRQPVDGLELTLTSSWLVPGSVLRATCVA